jgi:hypothetical protein
MMSVGHSGVIACHSISTTRAKVTIRTFPPYEAWPAITNWLTYYTLPTINARYEPKEPAAPVVSLEEAIINGYPVLTRYKGQLGSMVEDFYQAHFGDEDDDRNFQVAIRSVIATLLLHEWEEGNYRDSDRHDTVTAWLKTSSREDVISDAHEHGHSYSLQVIRPAITQLKAVWSDIEALLHQAASGSADDFWDNFTDLKSTLKNCLTNSLALEELRANIMALCHLPSLRDELMSQLYGGKNKNITKKEHELFRSLYYVTNGNLYYARDLTLLAECIDPRKPVCQLEQILNALKAMGTPTWSGVQWYSWFTTWKRIDAWVTAKRMLGELNDPANTGRLIPTAILNGKPNGIVEITNASKTIRLSLFYESLRQQLFCLKRVRTLTCPFKEPRRRCCGFGRSIWNIWAAIPPEQQRRLKPPSRIYVKSAVNCPF